MSWTVAELLEPVDRRLAVDLDVTVGRRREWPEGATEVVDAS